MADVSVRRAGAPVASAIKMTRAASTWKGTVEA